MTPAVRLTATALVVLGVVCGASRAQGAFKHLTVGDTPPGFVLRDLAGSEQRSADLVKDRITVFIFWAAWSPRSAEILADLQKLVSELETERVRLVAISADHERFTAADHAAIREILAASGFTGTALVDEGLVVFNDYGAMALPSSAVLDEKGRVTFTLAGYPTTMRSDLADAVLKALGLPTEAELRPPQPVVPKNHALQYYNFGRRLLEKGQEEKAVGQFATALERDPEFVPPRIAIGLHHLRRGDAGAAAEEFRRARELAPDDAEVLYQGALAEIGAGKLSESEKLFDDLAAEYPDRAGYVLGRAVARRFLGLEEQYRSDRQLALDLVPPEPRVLRDLGAAAEARRDFALAAEFYREALRRALLP